MPASVRFEIFPADLNRCIDFYTKVLEFKIAKHEDDGYAYMIRDDIRIGAAVKKPSDYPAGARDEAARNQYRIWPTGVEIVFEVDDLEAERDRVVKQGWKLDSDIELQQWGLRDFRIVDPDGFYIRITNRYSDGKADSGK